MEINSEIIIKTSIVGFHNWKDAPKEVEFLRNRHRHMFNIKVGMPVTEHDRQLEFFIEGDKLQTSLIHLFNRNGWGHIEFGGMSCEMIATQILKSRSYYSWVEVWEDDENGARVESNPLITINERL